MIRLQTIFAQLLSLIPGSVFDRLDEKYKAGRSSRQLTPKRQFKIMAFHQLGGRSSIRDTLRCMNANENKIYHMGLKTFALSSICDANKDRSPDYFIDLFKAMYAQCLKKAPHNGFRLKSKIFSLDSTTISLCLGDYPWATFRDSKGGLKVSAYLDHDGNVPASIDLATANVHDSRIKGDFDLPKESIVVCDKAYNSYSWFKSLNDSGRFFVTRIKDNAKYAVVARKAVKKELGLTSDQTIRIERKDFTLNLRRVGYRDPQTGKHYAFLTNNFRVSALTIANLYKSRWQVEIFFKEIKQALRIKKFVGQSVNAVSTQVYTAMIIYLLLAYMKFLNKLKWSITKILQIVNINLLDNSHTIMELLCERASRASAFEQLPLFAQLS